MKIAHVINKHMPPLNGSGGANRLLEWLAQEQRRAGHEVCIVSPAGRDTDYARHIALPVTASTMEFLAALPDDTDIVHHHGTYDLFMYESHSLTVPFVQTVHGIPGTDRPANLPAQLRNAVFVSESHMLRYGGKRYIYNGIPISDYVFSSNKTDFLLFLAKVRRRKKGVDSAIRIATGARQQLVVAGGWRLRNLSTWLPVSRFVKSIGPVEGARKFRLLADSKALLVPIEWDEPFGLTVVEAMASGTPVIASNRGALPELIEQGKTGFICNSIEEFHAAIGRLQEIDAAYCRQQAEQKFSAARMQQDYCALYKTVMDGAGWG